MKKTTYHILYYIFSFLTLPLYCLFIDALDKLNILSMNPLILFSVLFLLSAIIGSLSLFQQKFDYIIAILLPVSFFCFMFAVGFFDKSEFHSGHDLKRGIETAFQTPALIAYLIISVTALVTSFKPIRILKIFRKDI